MRPVLPALLVPLLALAAAAPAPRDRVPPATPTGPAVNCVRITDLRESLVRDDRTIDFVTSDRRKLYRVTLPNACPGLGFERRFSYATSLSQLCSTDIITVLQQTGGSLDRGAGCGMGVFQPVTLADGRRAR